MLSKVFSVSPLTLTSSLSLATFYIVTLNNTGMALAISDSR